MSFKNRIKIAFREYISNDKNLAAAVAFVAGNEVSKIELFNVVNEIDNYRLENFRNRLVELIDSDLDTSSKMNLQELLYMINVEEKNRTLLIFCGPSCVGKDCIASILRNRLSEQGRNYNYLDKYTTRGRRGFNNQIINPSSLEPSSNYTYLDTLDDYQCNNDIVLKYKLYNFRYGYSKSHLLSNDYFDRDLACIYGKLESIDYFRKTIEKDYHRKTFAILLNATENELIDRLSRRGTLRDEETKMRLDVLRNQSRYIEKHEEDLKKQFDLIVDNSYNSSVSEVVEKIISSLNAQKFYRHRLATKQ